MSWSARMLGNASTSRKMPTNATSSTSSTAVALVMPPKTRSPVRLIVASLTPREPRSGSGCGRGAGAWCSTTGTGLWRATSSCTGETAGSRPAGLSSSGSSATVEGAKPSGSPSSTPVRAWASGSATGSTVPVAPSAPGWRVVSVTLPYPFLALARRPFTLDAGTTRSVRPKPRGTARDATGWHRRRDVRRWR